jgi:hypothetical protein
VTTATAPCAVVNRAPLSFPYRSILSDHAFKLIKSILLINSSASLRLCV